MDWKSEMADGLPRSQSVMSRKPTGGSDVSIDVEEAKSDFAKGLLRAHENPPLSNGFRFRKLFQPRTWSRVVLLLFAFVMGCVTWELLNPARRTSLNLQGSLGRSWGFLTPDDVKSSEQLSGSSNLFLSHDFPLKSPPVNGPENLFHPFHHLPDPGPDTVALEQIRRMTRHAWSNYYSLAGGCDELKPVTKLCRNWSGDNPTLMTPIDSLGTLWIMNLKDEFEEAKELVQKWNVTGPIRASFFETVIRVLGGLLSAHDLTGDHMFLEKAVIFATRAEQAFDPLTGLPGSTFNMQSSSDEAERTARSSSAAAQLDTTAEADLDDPVLSRLRHPDAPYSGAHLSLAEVGTFQLEMSYLADVTGEERWLRYVERCNDYLYKMSRTRTWGEVWAAEKVWLTSEGKSPDIDFGSRYEDPPDSIDIHPSSPQVPGLWSTSVVAGAHAIYPGRYTVGGSVDSFYEYLLKQWIYFGGEMEPRSAYLREMYMETASSVLRYMAVSERVPGRWEDSRPLMRVKGWPAIRTVPRTKRPGSKPIVAHNGIPNSPPTSDWWSKLIDNVEPQVSVDVEHTGDGANDELESNTTSSAPIGEAVDAEGIPTFSPKRNMKRRSVYSEDTESNGPQSMLKLFNSDQEEDPRGWWDGISLGVDERTYPNKYGESNVINVYSLTLTGMEM
ncbi:Endoplasmic reticulum mannosyl-oligosaccharide 1,2-alpha-mannosidase [Gonapodya sp. JEL0774]|nr:Endoplasmic reticulum mannosyl-oligosaccharide 1,2-alpha-mannosidase [Gonapodya sp. JEL0774]